MKPNKLSLIIALVAGICFLGSARVFGQQYTLSPSGNICGTTATLTMSGSQTGVTYQLETSVSTGTLLIGSPVGGTGSALTWTNVSVPTSKQYTVLTNAGLVAAITYLSPVLPIVGNVTASNGGVLYPGGAVTFTVNITQGTAVSYQWFNNGTPISGASSSTYASTAASSYTVLAISTCGAVMLTCPTITTSTLPGPDCFQLNTNPGTTNNYIISSTLRTPGVTSASATDAQLAAMGVCEVNQTIQYIDGLGRPLQTVQVKASPLGYDIVQPIAYDQYGRETTKYLPYVTAATTSDGAYQSTAITNEATYYNPTNSATLTQQPNGIVNTSYPYAQTNYEPSPLNRIIEKGAPGAAWQPVTGNTTGHTSKIIYTSNNTTALTDTANSYYVALYTVTINADQSRTLVQGSGTAAYYAAGRLSVTVTQNENWMSGRGGTIEEYKDKQGHVVLKRNYNWLGGILQRFSTYYIYDDLGNLAFVLTPMSGADATVPTQTILDNLCYQYRYDIRNRLVQKKIPGNGWEYTVYNQLDQPVLSQDAIQHNNNQWTVTKYDALGRVIVTGLWNAGSTIAPATLQASIYAGPQWDVRDAANNTTANPTGYVIGSYPALSKVLTTNYYDDYTFTGQPATFTTPTGGSTMTKGLLTGTKTAVLNTLVNTTPDMLWKVRYYDDLGRTTQTYAQHYLGGSLSSYNYDQINNTYDFANEVTASTRLHYVKNAGNNASTLSVTIANTYAYDHEGRKRQTWEQVNGGTKVLLTQVDYNEIGQVLIKHLHSETGSAPFLQDIGYAYNERGWLRTAGSSLFTEDMRYNTPDAGITHQYNGNIAEDLYSKTGVGTITDTYAYDQLNRLTKANSSDNLGETVTYDLMGNINSLTRTSPSAGTAILAYTYLNGNGQSNQLVTVTNNGAAFRTYGTYDLNGNAPSDGTTKLIQYNMLNLPQTITQSGATLATYTYDADGTKLRNNGSDGYWDYDNGIVYNGTTASNATIQFIKTEDGQAIPLAGAQGSSWNYEYNLTDHLGNVRVTFDKNPTTGVARNIQEDEYYAFGLRSRYSSLSSNNRYLYNGKEVQTDLNGQYDYGARFYDPVIVRWTGVDPLAEKYANWSPYTYCFDNPIKFFDFEGGDPTPAEYKAFFLNYGVNLYLEAKSQGATVLGALTAVSQIALESGYGINRASRLYNNPFSIMDPKTGKPIKFDNYRAAMASYFVNLKRHWPGALSLFNQSSISGDQLDKTFYEHKYADVNSAGNWAGAYDNVHKNDPDYDYGEKIKSTDNSIGKRFIAALDQGIADNNTAIQDDNNSISNDYNKIATAFASVDLDEITAAVNDLDNAVQDKEKKQQQNETYNGIKNELLNQ